MAFFDRMKDSLTTAGQEVSQKAKNATENVRLGNLIKNNDKMVDKLLYQVGLKYYEAHGQEEGTEYQELFAEINRLKSENAGYQQELDNLAATNKCPQCGFGNNAGAKFCISCGAPLNQIPVAPAQSAPGKCCDKCGALNDAEALFCTECGNRLNTQPSQPMTYTVPEADEVVETTVAETIPEEAEFEKVDSKEVDSKEVDSEEVDSKEVDSEEAVTEVDDTQEPVTEKGPACCAKCGAPLEEDALFCTSCGARV